MKYAFRCKFCGHLETSAQAAESPHPVACAVCGHGVSFHPVTGIRKIDKDNWDILAGMKTPELQKIGLTPADVEVHVIWPGKQNSAKRIAVEANERIGAKDHG